MWSDFEFLIGRSHAEQIGFLTYGLGSSNLGGSGNDDTFEVSELGIF